MMRVFTLMKCNITRPQTRRSIFTETLTAELQFIEPNFNLMPILAVKSVSTLKSKAKYCSIADILSVPKYSSIT